MLDAIPFEGEEKECLSKFSVPNFILALLFNCGLKQCTKTQGRQGQTSE